MYQLIGITIDFFAFNSITKIDVKSNENDFNYPFITFSFEDGSLENICADHLSQFGQSFDPFGWGYHKIHYDENCNVNLLNRLVQDGLIDWKVHFLLNCKRHSLLNLTEWNDFTNKLAKMSLRADENFKSKNYGWYLPNSNDKYEYLMVAFLTIGFNVEKRMKTLLEFSHLDSSNMIGKFKLTNIVLHSQPVPNLSEMSTLSVHFNANNYSLIVRKVLRSYLEPPFGNCSHYSPVSYRAFNASSHMQCYRRCRIYVSRKYMGCHPVFIDFSISELDLEPNEEYNKTNVCLYEQNLEFEEKRKTLQLNQKCVNLCPKDCLTVDYFYDILETDSDINTQYWYQLNESEKYSKKSLIWDSTQPMFEYKEVGVMSFTDYLSSIGGLIGLWFGLSAKDIIDWFIQTKPWNVFVIKLGHLWQKTTFNTIHNNRP